ncbi:glutathione ABC transporter substrate-binding protein [Salinicoccus sp. ID82-1]|uniref:glutathione ABC transporter substrate-binding protein n=1 Tax=Salinicoccus sp. ID82-1 TaxID=2820269 RepID=UPI001F2A0AE3|nr:glutathione ABC transporter substrate-binding protein [Salinicoccus sp. ID82-1]MCG1009747.1 glutathione ABC transporter substrate-binding protein [Salinicoccus sp. ID82-1]
MKKFSYYILLTLTIAVLAACTDDSEVGTDTSAASDSNSTSGDIVLSLPSDAVSLDPHGSNDSPSEKVRSHIYEGLVAQDENLEIVPELATEWEQVDDTTWHFTLREGVMFHDGSPFNAEVAKANFDRLLDPSRGSTRAFVLEMIEEVNVVDEQTLEIVTQYPFAPLPGHLTHGAGNIISKALIDEDYQYALDEAGVDMTLEEYYALRESGGAEHEEVASQISEFTGTKAEQHPVGTGYLQYEDRQPGESTTLARFADYWDGPASFDTLTLKVVPEAGSRVAELETGSSHAIADVPSSDIARIENDEDLSLARSQSVAIEYIGINTQSEPLDDVRVRKAITHAFNKQAVLEGVYNGAGIVADSPLAPNVFGYDENLETLDYDMDKARALLEEAGYADGFSLNIMVNNDNPERVDTAIWLQESLAELNIDLEIQQLEWGAFLDATGEGKHDMFIMSWGNSTGDPDNALTPLFHSSRLGSPGNRAFLENDEVDSLLDAARQESDTEAREALYGEVQQILIDEAPAIFIMHPQYMNAYSNRLDGLTIDSYDQFNFKNATLEEE